MLTGMAEYPCQHDTHKTQSLIILLHTIDKGNAQVYIIEDIVSS